MTIERLMRLCDDKKETHIIVLMFKGCPPIHIEEDTIIIPGSTVGTNEIVVKNKDNDDRLEIILNPMDNLLGVFMAVKREPKQNILTAMPMSVGRKL